MDDELTELEERLMPDPANGDLKKKERLLELAKEHRVLRVAAENGLTLDGAIRFIETNHVQLAAAKFPEKYYGMLKGLGNIS
jgi:hypothetical protein